MAVLEARGQRGRIELLRSQAYRGPDGPVIPYFAWYFTLRTLLQLCALFEIRLALQPLSQVDFDLLGFRVAARIFLD